MASESVRDDREKECKIKGLSGDAEKGWEEKGRQGKPSRVDEEMKGGVAKTYQVAQNALGVHGGRTEWKRGNLGGRTRSTVNKRLKTFQC